MLFITLSNLKIEFKKKTVACFTLHEKQKGQGFRTKIIIEMKVSYELRVKTKF